MGFFGEGGAGFVDHFAADLGEDVDWVYGFGWWERLGGGERVVFDVGLFGVGAGGGRGAVDCDGDGVFGGYAGLRSC